MPRNARSSPQRDTIKHRLCTVIARTPTRQRKAWSPPLPPIPPDCPGSEQQGREPQGGLPAPPALPQGLGAFPSIHFWASLARAWLKLLQTLPCVSWLSERASCAPLGDNVTSCKSCSKHAARRAKLHARGYFRWQEENGPLRACLGTVPLPWAGTEGAKTKPAVCSSCSVYTARGEAMSEHEGNRVTGVCLHSTGSGSAIRGL